MVIYLDMQLIKKYIAYLRNNPEHYWFKRKPFGWGWTPVTWQGWTASSIAVALIVLISIHSSEETQAVTFIEVALIEEPRSTCLAADALPIAKAPKSCLVVGLLSVKVTVPAVPFIVKVFDDFVNVIWLEQVVAQIVKFPVKPIVGLFAPAVTTVEAALLFPPISRLPVTVKVPEAKVCVAEAPPGKTCKLLYVAAVIFVAPFPVYVVVPLLPVVNVPVFVKGVPVPLIVSV